MTQHWLDPNGLVLGAAFPLPLSDPFTTQAAYDAGISKHALSQLIGEGLIRRVLRGVYVAMQAPDDTLLRATALSLVLPPTAIVVDRTAGWLHGVDILPRGAVLGPPPIEVVHVDDTRVRRPEVRGSRRELLPSDLVRVHGVPVTTPLRTALDLGRLLWRYDALAAIDGFLRLGLPREEMLGQVGRFKGFRGVRQLRALIPLGDARSESNGESALRLHWHEAMLPAPTPQFWVYDDAGEPVFRIDLTAPGLRFGAEYDGQQFHSTEDDRRHDEERRRWLTEERGWHLEVFTKKDVYGRGDPLPRLRAGLARARRNLSRWSPARRSA